MSRVIRIECPHCCKDMDESVLDDYTDENGDVIWICTNCGAHVNEYDAHYRDEEQLGSK